jgi:D-alanine-D-alanine ligase-like ATP-grasp enzyme
MTLFVPIIHASHADRPDEADTLHAAEAIAAALQRLGYRSEVVALDLDLSALERLAARRPHAIFNLVEAMRGDAALAHLAPAVLEHFALTFTGAGSAACITTLSKLMTKQVLAAQGLPTADWWMEGQAVPDSTDARELQ